MDRSNDLLILFAGCVDLADRAGSHESINREIDRLVAESYPSVELRVEAEHAERLGELKANLESGETRIVTDRPGIVVLSLAGEVRRLVGENSEEELLSIQADLVSTIDDIKSANGAHVLVANLSTLDPANLVFNYHGLVEEPFVIRAHRLNRMLASISHEKGISVIDVDRVIAEIGGAETVIGPASYNEAGLRRVAAEIFRVVEDYGFLDERPILEQVGAAAAQ